MKKVFLTIVLTLVVLIAAALIYIYSGLFEVSQLSHHNKVTQWIVNKTMERSIVKRIKQVQPVSFEDTTMIATGLSHYSAMCVVCHGGPGVEPSELAKGLYPEPPVLYKSQLPDAAGLFWIIKYGIRMTGMPAFAPTHSDAEIWAITAFMLKKMNTMSPAEYQEWIKVHPAEE